MHSNTQICFRRRINGLLHRLIHAFLSKESQSLRQAQVNLKLFFKSLTFYLVVDEPAVWNQFVESILGNEPIEVNSQVDLSPEKRGRKRKLSEKTEKEALNSELDLDDYRKMRIRFVNSSFFFVKNFFSWIKRFNSTSWST